MANWLFIFTVPWVSTKPGNRTSHPKTPWTGCTHKPFSQLTTRCDQWNDSASQSDHVPVLFMPSYRSLYCFKPSSLRSLWRSHLIPGKGNTPWLFLFITWAIWSPCASDTRQEPRNRSHTIQELITTTRVPPTCVLFFKVTSNTHKYYRRRRNKCITNAAQINKLNGWAIIVKRKVYYRQCMPLNEKIKMQAL